MEKKVKKIGFFKRLKMALFELENYMDFTAEKFGKSLWFMLRMIIIFSLIITISTVAYVYVKYESPTEYANSILPEFTYNKESLDIESDEESESTIVTIMNQLEPTYRDIIPDGTYTKSDLLNYISQNEDKIMAVVSVAIFIEGLLDLFVFWVFVAISTSIVGLIILKFSQIKMKYSKLFAISIYSSTLSIILTVIYTMVNNYFNIYIDIFEYLIMLIAYIYITAVIYMIKADLIKQQLELIRIATVQAKVKEQMEDKDDENKEDKKEQKDDDKEDKKENDEGTEEPINDEPDGSEI